MMELGYKGVCDRTGPPQCPGYVFIQTCSTCQAHKNAEPEPGKVNLQFGKSWDHDRTIKERQDEIVGEYRRLYGHDPEPVGYRHT